VGSAVDAGSSSVWLTGYRADRAPIQLARP